MLRIILAVSFLLAIIIGFWAIPKPSYFTKDQSHSITSELPEIVDDIKPSGDGDLNDILITKVLRQYFNFAAEGKFSEINRILANHPISNEIFVDVETKADNKIIIPDNSNTNLKSKKIKEISSPSLADSSLSIIFTKKLFPEFIQRNKLRIITVKVIWLRGAEAKAEVSVADNEQNNLLRTIYFRLTKDKSGEWRIFEVNLIDLDINKQK